MSIIMLPVGFISGSSNFSKSDNYFLSSIPEDQTQVLSCFRKVFIAHCHPNSYGQMCRALPVESPGHIITSFGRRAIRESASPCPASWRLSSSCRMQVNRQIDLQVGFCVDSARTALSFRSVLFVRSQFWIHCTSTSPMCLLSCAHAKKTSCFVATISGSVPVVDRV